MTTLNLVAGQISPIIEIGKGTRVTSSGNGTIEYYPGALADAKNGGTFEAWPKGTAAGSVDAIRGMCVRATATGAMTVTIEEGKNDLSVDWAYWDSEYATTSTDASGNTVLVGADGVRIPLNPTLRAVGYESEQPAGIISPVTNFGKIVTNFTTGRWAIQTGLPVLTQGYTGWDGSGAKTGIVSRTGQPSMLKVVPAANTAEEIALQVPATNLLNASLNGKFGIWVYIEAQPGYQVGGTLAGGIGGTIGTSAVNLANALAFGFTTNQIREGWNFLKFVMRDPQAYIPSSGVTEYHPFGVTATTYGTGVDTDIVNSPVAKMILNWSNLLGCTMYFDSIWTGFETTAQVVLGNDGGNGLLEYAMPVFDAYGWKGYFAFPYNTADTGASTLTYQANLSNYPNTTATAVYAKGWDCINHTVTHPSMGGYTTEPSVVYQVDQAKAMMLELGFQRGIEFYASPQSSSSRLSEAVIKSTGIKLQRHARKTNTSITQFGIDNPHHIGGIDIGSAAAVGVSKCTGGVNGTTGGMQVASKIMRFIDVIEAYGDTCFPFWHGITTTGDTGTGEVLTGDNLQMTKSAFEISMAYIRTRELAGGLTVPRGMTGFWYGV